MKTLAKLLKEKNAIVSKINDVKRRITNENIVENDNVSKWDTREEYTKLLNLTNKLVETKTNIARLNSTVADKIFRLSELKAIVAFLYELDTREGKFIVRDRYETRSDVMTKKAQLDSVFVQQEIDSLTVEINTLQDELEAYNHSTQI